MIKRLNRTLKTMLRKKAVKFGTEWDTYLPGALWAYCITPHTATSEKPPYLLFGYDCHTPTEATLAELPWKFAAKANQEAQYRYKHHDKSSTPD